MCVVGPLEGDLVADTPILRRGFAGECALRGSGGHFALLLVCRFFAVAQNDRRYCCRGTVTRTRDPLLPKQMR